MGLNWLQLELILNEHCHRPLEGRLLTIGRQEIGLSHTEALELVKRSGCLLRQPQEICPDQSHSAIIDRDFFSLFSNATISSIDVTDYEGADIIHDISEPVPEALYGAFDLIINGSCLDNIFDTAAAMRNMSHMLKAGGRIIHFEWGNSEPAAYIKFSPDWFYDYYAINAFSDCKTYVFHYPNTIDLTQQGVKLQRHSQRSPFDVEVWHFHPLVEINGQIGYECSYLETWARYLVAVIAEKDANSTSNKSPIQKHYRGSQEVHKIYIDSVRKFYQNPRPVFGQRLSNWSVHSPSPNSVLTCVAVGRNKKLISPPFQNSEEKI